MEGRSVNIQIVDPSRRECQGFSHVTDLVLPSRCERRWDSHQGCVCDLDALASISN